MFFSSGDLRLWGSVVVEELDDVSVCFVGVVFEEVGCRVCDRIVIVIDGEWCWRLIFLRGDGYRRMVVEFFVEVFK